MALFREYSKEVLATIRSKIAQIEKEVGDIDKTFRNNIISHLESVPAILEKAFHEEESALATIEQRAMYGMKAKEILWMGIARGEDLTLSQCQEAVNNCRKYKENQHD